MAEGSTDVDPEVLADLQGVERFMTFFGAGVLRPEFWELCLLFRENREVLRRELARLERLRAENRPPGIDPAVMDRLLLIRRRFQPMVKRLRDFLGAHPSVTESFRLDLAIVLLMSSQEGRAAAERWSADPAAQAEDVLRHMADLERRADAYCRALVSERRDAPAPEPGAPDVRPGDIDSTIRVHPDFLEDLRRVNRARALLEGIRPPAELWELVLLILVLREETRSGIEELERLKKEGRPGEFAGAAYAFREKIGRMRERYGELVGALRRHLIGLLGAWEGDTEELVLAIMVATVQGRHRVRQWLQKPAESRDELLHWVRVLRDRARKYQDSLRGREPSEQPLPRPS
ncbi:MAG TPA: hypothetical protein VNO22_18255 [Planctomycetota bacterium]|nr:hypothetical protein [Planctomycetota bacterium]